MLAEICLGSSFSKYSVVSLLSENTTNLDSGLMDLFKRVFFKYSINTSNFGSSFTFSHSVDNSLSNFKSCCSPGKKSNSKSSGSQMSIVGSSIDFSNTKSINSSSLQIGRAHV